MLAHHAAPPGKLLPALPAVGSGVHPFLYRWTKRTYTQLSPAHGIGSATPLSVLRVADCPRRETERGRRGGVADWYEEETQLY